MPTIVTLEGPRRQRVDVDLDRLTPRARALAEIVAAQTLQTLCPVVIESARTIREMGPSDAELEWYTPEQLDRPHRTTWDNWAKYPASYEIDLHDYFERQAAKLPIGYYPVGSSKARRARSADAAKADVDLITKQQVMEVLRHLGRPISAAALDNYRSRPPAGWPQPARYVGRTPMWSRAAVEEYAHQAVRKTVLPPS